jgi:hypothetical protein
MSVILLGLQPLCDCHTKQMLLPSCKNQHFLLKKTHWNLWQQVQIVKRFRGKACQVTHDSDLSHQQMRRFVV